MDWGVVDYDLIIDAIEYDYYELGEIVSLRTPRTTI